MKPNIAKTIQKENVINETNYKHTQLPLSKSVQGLKFQEMAFRTWGNWNLFRFYFGNNQVGRKFCDEG